MAFLYKIYKIKVVYTIMWVIKTRALLLWVLNVVTLKHQKHFANCALETHHMTIICLIFQNFGFQGQNVMYRTHMVVQ